MASLDSSRSIFRTDSVLASQDTLQTRNEQNTALMNEPLLIARDAEWEAELLTHLSEHEQRFREFTRTGYRNNPYEIAQRALGMVQAIDAYSATQARSVLLIESHLPAVQEKSKRLIQAIHSIPKPLPPKTFLGFNIGTGTNHPSTAKLCYEILQQLPGVMEGYLVVLGNGFSTGPMAAKWIETCGIFIRQLTKLTTVVAS